MIIAIILDWAVLPLSLIVDAVQVAAEWTDYTVVYNVHCATLTRVHCLMQCNFKICNDVKCSAACAVQ